MLIRCSKYINLMNLCHNNDSMSFSVVLLVCCDYNNVGRYPLTVKKKSRVNLQDNSDINHDIKTHDTYPTSLLLRPIEMHFLRKWRQYYSIFISRDVPQHHSNPGMYTDSIRIQGRTYYGNIQSGVWK